MKIKDFNLEKDFKDFADTFNSYAGMTQGSMSNNSQIQWMMAVTEELGRLHAKINQVMREVIEIQNKFL